MPEDRIFCDLPEKIKKAGYKSVEKFCYENKIPKQTIYDLLHHRNDVRLSTIQSIAEALETEPYKLLKP